MTRSLFAFAMLFAMSLTPHVRAHGGPPAIEDVLASDDRGPWLAELSEGFALRGEGGSWSFVCPALFVADTPPVSATVEGSVWLAGGMDLFELSANRSLRAADMPAFASSRVLALDVLEGALVALRAVPVRDPGGILGSELIVVQGDTEVTLRQDPTVFWNVMAVQAARASRDDGVIWLARIDGQGFEVLGLSQSGEELMRATMPWPTPPLSIRLGSAGELVFVHVYDNVGYRLVQVATRTETLGDLVLVAEADGPIRGPVQLGFDEVLLITDGALLAYDEGVIAPSERAIGSEPLTCLTPEHACTASRLFSIEAVEQAGGFEASDALLDLAELLPPVLRPEDPELAQHCTAQWLVFQADLERVGITSDAGVAEPDPDAGPPDAGTDANFSSDGGEPGATSSSSGCAIVKRNDVHGAAQLLSLGLCATAIYARRRRAQSRCSV